MNFYLHQISIIMPFFFSIVITIFEYVNRKKNINCILEVILMYEFLYRE